MCNYQDYAKNGLCMTNHVFNEIGYSLKKIRERKIRKKETKRCMRRLEKDFETVTKSAWCVKNSLT